MIECKRYLDKLISRIDNKMIKVITGVRRSGKSTLLFNLFYHYLITSGVPEDHIIMLSLDDIDNREYRDPEKLYAFLKEKIRNSSEQYFIFLDEIQLAISKEELKLRNITLQLTSPRKRPGGIICSMVGCRIFSRYIMMSRGRSI